LLWNKNNNKKILGLGPMVNQQINNK
jgi:hypothetical protein